MVECHLFNPHNPLNMSAYFPLVSGFAAGLLVGIAIVALFKRGGGGRASGSGVMAYIHSRRQKISSLADARSGQPVGSEISGGVVTREMGLSHRLPSAREMAEELRAYNADRRMCSECRLKVCKAGWAQCWGESSCPEHWDLLKK